MVGAALATGVVYVGLATAGPAAAKTHHGVDAPGNPFSDAQTAAGYQSAGSSFTTVRITRSTLADSASGTRAGGEVVSTTGDTTVRSSGGLVSGRGDSTGRGTSQSESSGVGTATGRGGNTRTNGATSATSGTLEINTGFSATRGGSESGSAASATGNGGPGSQAKTRH
jgi:hypothetical protein